MLGLGPAERERGDWTLATGLATGVGVDLNLFLGLGIPGGFITPFRFVYFRFTETKMEKFHKPIM